MGRIAIVYFSGTGNTWTIAQQYAETFLARGHQVELLPVEEVIQDRSYDALAAYDFLGLGYPVHAWNAPRLMDWFISQLPRAEGQKAFVFVTAGTSLGGALDAIRDRLTSLGYDVMHDTHYYTGPDRLPRRGEKGDSAEVIAKRLAWCSVDAREAVSEILASTERHGLAGDSARFFLSNLLWRAYRLGCKRLHRFFFADEKCDQCAICVQTCPTQNIRLLDGRVLFDTRCTFCLRCLNICPLAAIQLTGYTREMPRYLAPGYAQVIYRDYQRL